MCLRNELYTKKEKMEGWQIEDLNKSEGQEIFHSIGINLHEQS